MSGSSGDLLADRRYAYAEAAFADGDAHAAVDLAHQVIERVPGWAPAWFLLGSALERRAAPGDDPGDAYRRARDLDGDDALGAGLRLALLGQGEPTMPGAYVRRLFDEYADRFDAHLRRGLAYRGPEILADAIGRACSRRLRSSRFGRALDLGCGTGLAGEVMRERCDHLAGIDLSPAMIRHAARKNIYESLGVSDINAALAAAEPGSLDLILAADVFVYLGDLAPVAAGAARALGPGGLLAFTVQVHGGAGIVLGADHRFAHAPDHVRAAVIAAGLDPVVAEAASTRRETGVDVPGLVMVAEKRAVRRP